MTSQTETQRITINTLSNISKSKAIEAYLRLLIYKRNTRGTLIKNLEYSSLRNHLLQTTFSDFLMLVQIFLAPQAKRRAVIGTKHDIYELPHELPIDSRLCILEK